MPGSATSERATLKYLTGSERHEIEAANASGRQPMVLLHGLWLLSRSWERWAELFNAAGYTALMPGWPDDPETVDEANASPHVFAHKTIAQVAKHFEIIVKALDRQPVIIGHSFGGLIAEMLAGRGLSLTTVAIAPVPFRGVLPLPFSALKSAWPVLGNPANRNRAVPLTRDQFRFGFANAVDDEEAGELFETFAVPASGAPIFQAAAANLNPWTEAKVDTEAVNRGPLLILSGEKDNTVPRTIAEAAYRREQQNSAVTEFAEMPGRGHSLTIDHGWREVAEATLGFVRRFA